MLKDKRSLEMLLREADAAFVLLGSDGIVRDINSPALHLLGGEREDYVGKDALTLVDPVDWFFVRRKLETAGSAGIPSLLLTIRLRRKDRPSDWHMIRVEPFSEDEEDDCRLVRIEHVSLWPERGG